MSGRADAAVLRPRLTARAVALMAIVVMLGLAMVVPVRQYLEQRSTIGQLERQVQELRAERAAMKRELERLSDPGELERLARECLGMVKPGEIRFVPVDDQPDDPSSRRC